MALVTTVVGTGLLAMQLVAGAPNPVVIMLGASLLCWPVVRAMVAPPPGPTRHERALQHIAELEAELYPEEAQAHDR